MKVHQLYIGGVAAAVLVVAIAGVYVYRKRAAIGQAVNITSDKNLAYQGANAVIQAITGEADTSLGSKIYDWLHPFDDANHINDPVKVTPKLESTSGVNSVEDYGYLLTGGA